jgi:hypothetical protein
LPEQFHPKREFLCSFAHYFHVKRHPDRKLAHEKRRYRARQEHGFVQTASAERDGVITSSQVCAFITSPLDRARQPGAGLRGGAVRPPRRSRSSPGLQGGARVGAHATTGEIYPAALIGAIAPGAGDPFSGMVVAAQGPGYPKALHHDRGVPLRVAPRLRL